MELLPIAIFSILKGRVEKNAQKNGSDWDIFETFSDTSPRSNRNAAKQCNNARMRYTDTIGLKSVNFTNSQESLRLKCAKIRVSATVPISTTTLNEKPKISKPVFCLKIQHDKITKDENGISIAGIRATFPQLMSFSTEFLCKFQLGIARVIVPQDNKTSPTVAISSINSRSLEKIPTIITNCPIMFIARY